MIRVFVGCAPNHEDLESQAVLEWSIRKHASEPVEIEWMRLSRDPASPWFSDPEQRLGWQTDKWATPFSGFRWAIPYVCNYAGRAIYCDSDVIFMADIAELWRQELEPGKAIIAKGGKSWRLCVSLWDCAAMVDHLLPFRQLAKDPDAHAIMSARVRIGSFVQAFQGDWNCLDGEGHHNLRDGLVKAIHYTDMSSQPQLRHALPRLAAEGRRHWFNGEVRRHPRADLEALFDELLAEAEANGYGPRRYAQAEPFGAVAKKDLASYRGRRVA